MADNVLDKQKMCRLFGIPTSWWGKPLRNFKLHFPKERYYADGSEPWCVLKDEYRTNAHPHQEYLADLKVARYYIEEQLKLIKETDMIGRIDRAIEASKPFAREEIASMEIK